MKNYFFSTLLFLAFYFICNSQTIIKTQSTIDYVPNEKVARQVAEVILISIYGQEIKKQKPFNVKLQGDSLWIITGVQKKVEIGGVAYIEIQKKDCKILNVTHGK